MMIAKELSNEKLADCIITLDKDIKRMTKELNVFKSEIQARGLAILDDQNTKYTKFYGKNGNCAVADTQSMKVLNTDRLKNVLPDGIFKDMVKETTETKYDYDKMLEKALKAIFNEDYTFEMTLEEFLDTTMNVKPDEKQKKLLVKKLKGDYEKDRELLCSVMGMDEGSEAFDVELWYIYKIKNAELIKAFLPEEGIDSIMEEIRKCIIVESKTSIALDYEKEK